MAIPTKFQQGVFYILDSNNNLVTSIEVNTYEDYRRIMSIRALQTEDEFKFKFDTSGDTSATFSQNDINSAINFSGIPATAQAFGALDDAPAFGPKTLSEDFPSESKSVANTVTSVTLVRDSFISSLRFGFSNGANVNPILAQQCQNILRGLDQLICIAISKGAAQCGKPCFIICILWEM